LKVSVLEYWSVEKKDVNPFVITPTLQYSNTPKLIIIINIYCLCLGAFVAILFGLSGLGLYGKKELSEIVAG